ncbi:Transcription-repair-coupling factor [Paraliobacillus sp. PM-2]|uniref:DEAD/DEAH box helicase n=1 Tax=Paraliobacillus sp. PM-2 TaxID=1462524 RepID=UPI00061C447A|nr:helicase-related protein [Paraliobacillus sp. PM-2]CQR46392.1 Transcription-repair-coupling factor [Paraliobacillus sp. PM-2]
MLKNLFPPGSYKIKYDFSFLPSSVRTPTQHVIEASNLPLLCHQLAGKLLLREELPFDHQQLQVLQQNHLIQAIPSITTKPTLCRRCGNTKASLFGKLPCARCHTNHLYCRNCIEMGRVLQCANLYYWIGPKPTYIIPDKVCTWEGELTVAQQHAADRMSHMVEKGNAELLCWAVCGAGKTEMLFPAITKAILAGKRICLATPRADVVRELLPRFQQAFPNIEVTGLYGGAEKSETPSQLTIATTHQLIRFARAFDVVIIDEIDAFPFHADPQLPYVTKRAATENAAFIYLTATPRKDLKRRSHNRSLPTVFVPIRFHGHPLPEPRLVLSLTLKTALEKNQLPKTFWSWYHQRTNPERQLLLFVPVIKQLEALRCILQAQLPMQTIEAVYANDSDRELKIESFRNRQLSILLSTTILERGVTFPSVDVVVIDAGHAVFDQAALVQMAGRAGRSSADPTGEVIFLHDGKTNAMIQAKRMIQQMNRKARDKQWNVYGASN